MQVQARTLGRAVDRKIKFGKVTNLCEQCSRNLNALVVAHLGDSGSEALQYIRKKEVLDHPGLPLFNEGLK
jgi:hypothetical protein